jgi:hypothetical protein
MQPVELGDQGSWKNHPSQQLFKVFIYIYYKYINYIYKYKYYK